MYFKRSFLFVAAFALTFAALPSATAAHDLSMRPTARAYDGSYTFTISKTQHGDFSGCLTLTASGLATATIGSQKYSGGTYSVLNGILAATIPAQGYGQNAGMVFIADATRNLTKGYYDEVYGGEAFLTGKLAFGAQGSC
jgi:hypothetical protein